MNRNGYAPSLYDTRECFICGATSPLVRHEIYGGTRRSNSKRYGAWITLCPSCHERIHAYPLDYTRLKQDAQYRVQTRHDMPTNEFIKLFGKNYLED